MKVNSILFLGKSGGLLQATALEAGLEHFEEKVGPMGLGVNLQPYPTFPALCQVLALSGDPGDRHNLSLRLWASVKSADSD
jgi:hypothetical protein